MYGRTEERVAELTDAHCSMFGSPSSPSVIFTLLISEILCVFVHCIALHYLLVRENGCGACHGTDDDDDIQQLHLPVAQNTETWNGNYK